jgi:poly(3-hydroxybutyrate) depolymerase
MNRTDSFRLALVIAALPFVLLGAQAPSGTTFDDAIPPGANFDKAEFRLWFPSNTETLRGVVILMPGSNGDGRAQATDTIWQAFAAKEHFALLGVRFTDKPHDQSFIEDYVNVSRGSGQALLDALGKLAATSKHAELATAPFLMWGMSAGGQFNYEFTAWKPERVIAFVVNKGGIYYSALLSREARSVPAMLFIGGKDLDSRVQTITGLFALNRRGAALWALANEPGASHVVGRSRDVALGFYEDVLALRLGENGTLKALEEKSGFIGDPKTKAIQAFGAGKLPQYPAAWFPTERVAKAWEAMETEKPW